MIRVAVTFWCAYHETIVSAEHFYRCKFTREPQPAIHFHPVRESCTVSEWAKIAAAIPRAESRA